MRLVGIEVLKKHIASIISAERIRELHRVLQLLGTVSFVPSSLIRFTLMMEQARSSETSVLTRATHHIPENGILHSHRRENLKSYMAFFIFTTVRTSNLT
jgi:hypothetical protein